MARKPTPAEVFDDLLTRYERDIAEAFRQAIADLGAGVDLAGAIRALERNDIAGAVEALNIEPAAYGPLLDAMGRAYAEGGAVAAQQANARTGPAVVIRFDGRNPRAEAWLRTRSSQLVTQVVADQRTAVRSALTRGMAAGQNPRTVALDIVGRIDKATGARQGGILGLTSAQEGYVANARAELAGGDATALRAFLKRERRDKRFDRSIAKAIREETPLPADIQRKAIVAYQRRLLQLRGEVIAQVEGFESLAEAKHEAYRQAIESGKVRADQVTKFWRHFFNRNPREQHIAMQGKSVPFDQDFVLPDGTRMRFAHDSSAPVRHKAGCHCQTDYRIDFLANIR